MRIVLSILLSIFCGQIFGQIFTTKDGQINFVSNAPLEIIKAESTDLQGALDLAKSTFAFKIYIRTFEGFNSPLQQEHFYENYMEVSDFPLATFKGKVLEKIIDGKGSYRAKGFLDIHGKKVERIIEFELDRLESEVTFTSSFLVPLEDHSIDLPRIVYQKIAETINVEVQGKMKLRQ